MKSDRVQQVVVAIAVALAIPCWAQPKSFDDQKTELEAQTELLQKQLALRELLQRMAGPGLAGMPTVLAVIGLDGRLSARLQQSNGTVGTYGEGESVRPGMVVASITPRQVTLKVGSGKTTKAIPLEFAAGATMPGASPIGVPGVVPGLPAGPIPLDLLPAPPVVQIPVPLPLRPQAAAQVAPAAPTAPPTTIAPPIAPPVPAAQVPPGKAAQAAPGPVAAK